MKTHKRRQQHKKNKHQDIKQKEPPQKYRIGTISNTNLFKPAVFYITVRAKSSVVVLIVLCFGVDLLYRLHIMYVFIFKLSSGNLVAAYWEIATHSVYDIFSELKYLIVTLVFLTVFGV